MTRRERRRQSAYRDEILGLPAGVDQRGRTFGNYLPADDRRNNFLREEAATHAAERADVVTPFASIVERVRTDPAWTMHEWPTPHDVLAEGPERLLELLVQSEDVLEPEE